MRPDDEEPQGDIGGLLDITLSRSLADIKDAYE